MSKPVRRVIVIGGGISGLSAAYYLQRESQRLQVPIQLTVYESSPQFGGKIQTLHRDGCVIERGPDSFLARKRPIIDLTRELGIEDELVGLNPQARGSFILRDGTLHRMPAGMVLGIPTKLDPLFETGLLTMQGKIRALMDLMLPKRAAEGDEALGDLLERRFGTEMLEQIAEPILAGIYSGDLRRLSVRATYPQFQWLEERFGSLIVGMKQSQANAVPPEVPESVRGSVFLSYRRGLTTLVEKLIEALEGATLAADTPVAAIRKAEAGGYEVLLASGEAVFADAIVLAVPSFAAEQLLSPLVETTELRQIRYVSVANVVMAYRKEDLDVRLDGTGFVIPRKEGRAITACTWTSAKWLHTCPADTSLIRSYVGRAGDEERVDLSDAELARLVRAELLELMGIDAEPKFIEITRWRQAMPQYAVGHLDALAGLRERLDRELPGVIVAGAAYDGIGIPDCIQSGKNAAQKLAGSWTEG